MISNQHSVLVIEDEQDVQDYLACLFSDSGFAVKAVSDGEEALTVLETERPSLVTLDITMPRKTGIAVYRVMRKHPQWKHIPIIIVTGIAKEFEHFISSRRTVPPPDGYFQKPIDREKLLQLARRLTRGSAAPVPT